MDRYQAFVIETRQRELLRDAERTRWASRIHRRAASGRALRVLALLPGR